MNAGRQAGAAAAGPSGEIVRRSRLLPGWVRALAALLVVLAVARWISLTAAIWLLAAYSFLGLREYFSLADIRLQDRWALLASYLCIPFVFHLVAIDWYGFFIVSIPVYVFLIVPILVAAGRTSRGTVFSIGVIDFGLFLLVYCTAHIAYLMRFSLLLATFLVLAVAASDLLDRRLKLPGIPRPALRTAALIVSLALGWFLVRAAGVPAGHAVAVSLLTPVLVTIGNATFAVIEEDLGISEARLGPGRGRTLNALKPYLVPAPVVFHYLRYFTEVF